MKRIFLLSISMVFTLSIFAGGIVTNQNQSAMYTRMQARDATLGMDAVFYNPAGLTLLPNNGFFLSLHNQTLGQTRTIGSDYQYLNSDTYTGTVSAPFFPGIYAGYKMDDFVFSFGFNPVGGGGGGIYEAGLPSFEYPISDLVPALQSQGQDVRGYRMDAYFEGSSIYFGYQANISYKINDMIQIGLGARYVTANEAYKGHLKDVQLNMGGTWLPAPTVFTGISTDLTNGAAIATGAATDMQPLIDGGAGDLTFEQAVGAGAITPAERAALEGGLTAFGIDPTDMTIAVAQASYSGAAAGLTAAAQSAGATSEVLQDQEADYEKKATGITPIISVNIKPSEQFNFSLKYEFNTALEFTNNTTKDFTVGFNPETGEPITMFPDGAKTNLDIPALLVVGATYKPIDKLLISTGFHYYFDKNANWDGREKDLESNSWEFGIGAEYEITDKLLASLGYLRTKSYATDAYQSDLSHTLPSNTIGGGLAYKLSPKMDLNLAGSYTAYEKGTRDFEHDFAKSGLMVPIQESYDKPIWIIAIGLNIHFGATE